MAVLPLSISIDKSVTHIKISRIDEQGNDNTFSLQELDSIRIITQDPNLPEYLDFAITSISEFPTYYLYEISPSAQPLATSYGIDTILNSVDNNIHDFTFYAERTTPFTLFPPPSDVGFGDAEITGYNIIYTSSPNTFNSSTGIYTVGATSQIIDTSVTASITIQSIQGNPFVFKIKNLSTNEIVLETNPLPASFNSFTTYEITGSFPVSQITTDTGIIDIPLGFLENTQYQAAISTPGVEDGYTISNFSWTITQSVAAKSSPAPNTVILEPYLYDIFEYSDCNVLINNATEPQFDSNFFKVNYDTGQSIPTNQVQILQGTAEPAPVNPSNYTTRAQTYPRYNGVKSTAPDFNTSSNDGTGYGGLVVAGNPAPFVGYYTSKGGSTPEVLKKTIVNLDYIIDENINTQVPALSDFTIDTQKGLYPRGGYLYLDPDKNSTGQQFAGSNIYKIYRSGEYATPILYSQTGSSTGFLETLTFVPPGIETIPQFLSAKYVKNTSTTLESIKQSLYWRVRSDQYPNGKFGFNTFIGDSWPGENPNPVQSFFEPDPVKPVPNFTYPHTWNQIPIDSSEQIYNINNNLVPTFDNVVGGTPYSRGSFTIPSSGNPEISCKAKFTITIKWAPTLVNTTLSDPTSVNFQLNTSLPQANSKRIINPLNIPLSVGFRIMGTAIGWDFTQITPDQTYTLSPGETKTITVETDILPRNGGYVFVQGYAFFPNDYLEPSFFNIPGGITFLQEQFFNTTAQNRLNWFDASFTVLSSELEFIQVPEANEVEINYASNTPYITQVFNSLDTLTPEGNSSLAFVLFTSSFAPALGLIYPQVSSSGYDATIYPFEFPDNYNINLSEYLLLGTNGSSNFAYIPPPPGTFDYEIRFNADENQAYPIVGYSNFNDFGIPLFGLWILRPRTAILTSDTTSTPGPVPIENYQSFLIRRWIPRAGYIYLDVDASLGKGIIKPQFITDEIQAKIPQIVKELTDKGLITSTP